MKVNPMDWPARPDLDATIAQQQARINELKLALDKADPLDPSFLRYLELEQQLQAEREKVAILAKWNAKFRADIKRLEALAGLATEIRPLAGLWPNTWGDWCERYDALATQAPKAK